MVIYKFAQDKGHFFFYNLEKWLDKVKLKAFSIFVLTHPPRPFHSIPEYEYEAKNRRWREILSRINKWKYNFIRQDVKRLNSNRIGKCQSQSHSRHFCHKFSVYQISIFWYSSILKGYRLCFFNKIWKGFYYSNGFFFIGASTGYRQLIMIIFLILTFIKFEQND